VEKLQNLSMLKITGSRWAVSARRENG